MNELGERRQPLRCVNTLRLVFKSDEPRVGLSAVPHEEDESEALAPGRHRRPVSTTEDRPQ
jgi:hypothetical protein